MVHLREGSVLSGKYRILRPLGKGGEGSVWLAVHLQTVQLWAIKEIRKKGDGQEFHEVNMMKKLRHPSLPQILDVLEDEESVYLIMEYVRGHSLQEWVKREGHLSVEEVLEVGCQVSSALSYLHGQTPPVFHLDIKPANIIRKQNGRLVLVDFGAAKRAIEGTKEVDEKRYGTAGFAAPEQYDRSRPVDQRTDIYGLGATMYYLISGMRYAPDHSKDRIAGYPDYLGGIILSCVREAAQLRPENCKKLSQNLGKARRKYHFQRQRYRFWTAILLLTVSVGIAVRELPAEFTERIKQDWDYEHLLEEALCAGAAEREQYYRRAVFSAPERADAYLEYLEQADSDALFSEQEETFLRTLLYTIPLGKEETYEEVLAAHPEAYGEIAFRLGLLYWYDYGGSDGKKIAAGWFAKAVGAAEKSNGSKSRGQTWEKRARIYQHMSSYYERLGKQDESGERDNFALVYWKEIRQLLETDMKEQLRPVTALRFYLETVNQMVFLAGELDRSGVSGEEMEKLVEQLWQNTVQITDRGDAGELGDELRQEIEKQIQVTEEILQHLRMAQKEGTGGMG